MSAYVRYWLFTAFIISLTLFGWEHGFFAWAYDRFGDQKIVIAAAILFVIFLWAYVVVGHKAALRLWRDNNVLLRLVEIHSVSSPQEKKTAVEKMMREFYIKRADGYLKSSAVGRAFISLAERLNTVRHIKTPDPINRSMFQDYFEADLTRDVSYIEKFQWALFNIGFLGTLVGIVLALALQNIPVNSEETQKFVLGILSGAGLAYTTSVLGIGGGLVLFVLHSLIESCATNISNRFQNIMFETVFPIVHSDLFEHGKNNLREDAEDEA